MGFTHVRLATVPRDVLAGALRAAWTLRVEKNAATKGRGRPKTASAKRTPR
jgi:hypothetical protein